MSTDTARKRRITTSDYTELHHNGLGNSGEKSLIISSTVLVNERDRQTDRQTDRQMDRQRVKIAVYRAYMKYVAQ